MVYCSKCGHKNPDDAVKCSSCGESLAVRPERKARRTGRDECFGPRRGMEDECFGLPHGGIIFTIIFGVLIIFAGLMLVLRDAFDWSIDVWGSLWAIFIVIVGLLIIAGALSHSRR